MAPYSNLVDLECSRTGIRYEADRLRNLSEAGAPLLCVYDLERGERVLAFNTASAEKYIELLDPRS